AIARVAQRRPAAVDPHTHADLLVARPLACLEAALDLDRGCECTRCVGKGREELIGARVDLVAAGASHAHADETADITQHLCVYIAEPLEEARRALDVGEQERHCAARPALPAHGRSALAL